jgi:RNA polymerase sigma-70 factor (ECF subfamily)
MALRADDVNLGRDRVLVEMFQSGDGRAFEDLYRRYFQRIYRYCLKRVGDPHEAEELAQEAFARAYSAMPRLTGERRFYPWLSVIASRLCVDTHRRRGRTAPTAQVELGVVDGGQEDVLADVDRKILNQALERMSARHREVLHLREQEGWSYDRIARHLDVGVGTVEALLFRARRALRREFHALAGSESRLAAVPVIGFLARRLFDARGRLAELAGQAAPLVAASAMSVAVVVGSAVAGGGGGVAPAKAARAAAVPEIQLPALAPAQVAPAPAAPAGAASAPAAAPAAAPRPAAPVEVMSGDEAQTHAAAQPIHVEAGPVFVGLDPLGLVELP